MNAYLTAGHVTTIRPSDGPEAQRFRRLCTQGCGVQRCPSPPIARGDEAVHTSAVRERGWIPKKGETETQAEHMFSF